MKKMLMIFSIVLFLSSCTPNAIITLEEGTDTVEVFDIYQIRGCTVTLGDDEYRMLVVDNPVDNETVGEYVIQYEKEINGRKYTCQRVVFIVDQTSPELTLNPGIDTITIGDDWVDAGVTVNDNYDQEITASVDDSELNTLEEGTYAVYYTATDESGNDSTIMRIVHVISGE